MIQIAEKYFPETTSRPETQTYEKGKDSFFSVDGIMVYQYFQEKWMMPASIPSQKRDTKSIYKKKKKTIRIVN